MKLDKTKNSINDETSDKWNYCDQDMQDNYYILLLNLILKISSNNQVIAISYYNINCVQFSSLEDYLYEMKE